MESEKIVGCFKMPTLLYKQKENNKNSRDALQLCPMVLLTPHKLLQMFGLLLGLHSTTHMWSRPWSASGPFLSSSIFFSWDTVT